MVRFIPAYAGNSVFDRSHDYKTTVHPRLRGELEYFEGLPADIRRFIPAYAGNSLKDGINPSIHTLGI